MALTKRKDIGDQIVYLLGQIVKPEGDDDGYSTTIVTVDKNRDTAADPFQEDELPAINVLVGKGQINHTTSYDEHALDVSIELHTTSAITAVEAEDALADIASCIAANDTWGGYADGTNIESHNIDLTQTGDIITAATIEITVNYTTEKGKI